MTPPTIPDNGTETPFPTVWPIMAHPYAGNAERPGLGEWVDGIGMAESAGLGSFHDQGSKP